MFAYIDETGNSGNNLFDDRQPLFLAIAVMARYDLHAVHKKDVLQIAKKVGEIELHGNPMGLTKISNIASDIIKLFKKIRPWFGIAHVEKKYLALAKLFDYIFDSGENIAVPWHIYNFTELRVILLMQFSLIVTEDMLKIFWFECLLEKNKPNAYEAYKNLLQQLIGRTYLIDDKRVQEIIYDSCTWAHTHPEEITLYTDKKGAYQHLPNVVFIGELFKLIDEKSFQWKRPVKKIIHDEQSQFKAALKEWHTLHSSPDLPDKIRWVGGQELKVRTVVGSTFEMEKSDKNAGIQLADICLWLYKKGLDGKIYGPSSNLLNYINKHSSLFPFSFDHAEKFARFAIYCINNANIPPEQLEKGKQLTKLSEERRLKAMSSFIS